MSKDKVAQVIIRDLNKMNKRQVRSLVSWLRLKARALESAVEVGQPWLITHRDFSGLLRYGLMK